jgi:hypothetical protein
MPNKKVKKQDHRTKAIIVRFSPKELKLLQESMRQNKVKVKSKYIRQRLLDLITNE